MSESKRIKADYEHFLRTGDDYPHHQRHYDKKASDKLLCACAAFCALCCFLFGELILEIMK